MSMGTVRGVWHDHDGVVPARENRLRTLELVGSGGDPGVHVSINEWMDRRPDCEVLDIKYAGTDRGWYALVVFREPVTDEAPKAAAHADKPLEFEWVANACSMPGQTLNVQPSMSSGHDGEHFWWLEPLHPTEDALRYAPTREAAQAAAEAAYREWRAAQEPVDAGATQVVYRVPHEAALEFEWHQDRTDPNDWRAETDGAGLHVWRCFGGGWQWRMGPAGQGARIGSGPLQSRNAAQAAAEAAYREWRAGPHELGLLLRGHERTLAEAKRAAYDAWLAFDALRREVAGDAGTGD